MLLCLLYLSSSINDAIMSNICSAQFAKHTFFFSELSFLIRFSLVQSSRRLLGKKWINRRSTRSSFLLESFFAKWSLRVHWSTSIFVDSLLVSSRRHRVFRLNVFLCLYSSSAPACDPVSTLSFKPPRGLQQFQKSTLRAAELDPAGHGFARADVGSGARVAAHGAEVPDGVGSPPAAASERKVHFRVYYVDIHSIISISQQNYPNEQKQK